VQCSEGLSEIGGFQLKNYILAVDAGATRTTCAIADEEGRILGIGMDGSSSHYAVSVKKAQENLRSAIEKAMLSANLNSIIFSIGCFGLTALDSNYDYQLNKNFIDSLSMINRSVIVSDALTAYYAVTAGKPGIAVIAGTGSEAYGINEKGEEAQSGGKEWLINDEGSAYHIARDGLRYALRADDGRGEKTLLRDMFMEHFNISTFEDIVEEIYKDTDKSRIASLSPIVTSAARKGDIVASRILEEAGRELGLAAVAVARRLNIENERIIVGGVGGVFKAGEFVLKSFKATVKEGIPRAILKPPVFNAIQGAIILGLKESGIPITEQLESRIERGLENLNSSDSPK
jgi:N-acetylglucosamine kinase-like BadF-type ATPase